MLEVNGFKRIYLQLQSLMSSEGKAKSFWNASMNTSSYYLSVLDYYGVTAGQLFLGSFYRIYTSFTLYNVMIFLLQYVPMGFYMYKTVTNIYRSSRERIQKTKSKLSDVEHELEMVRTKLCIRDVEFKERAEKLRQEADRLQKVRKRVRQIISSDDLLRQAMDNATSDQMDIDLPATPEEEHNYIMQLINELNSNQSEFPENGEEEADCNNSAATEASAETSVYSSVSESDMKRGDSDECRFKVVKVTNVYKIAYLKHFIKQKRLRRANKQALLKKKMEGIKKLLEDWQKTLNMVINNQLSIFNIDSHPIDVMSQEAMGDFTKPDDLRPEGSDSDLRDSECDLCYDEYCLRWAQNAERQECQEDESQESGMMTEYYDPQDNGDNDNDYSPRIDYKFESKYVSQPLSSLPEETSSQLAIEEIVAEETVPEETTAEEESDMM